MEICQKLSLFVKILTLTVLKRPAVYWGIGKCYCLLPCGAGQHPVLLWQETLENKLFHLLSFKQSRDSSVCVALGYGLDDRGSKFRFPAGAGNFSLHHRVQNGSGAYTAYAMCTRGSFRGEQNGRSVKLTTHLHLVQRSKNEWSYTSTPLYASKAWSLVKAQGQLYLTFYLSFKCFRNINYKVFN
jgi:hypothetical protein